MSDVFNEYSRIMTEKGLVDTVKIAKPKDSEKSRPRGIDPEAIEMLYHVKPNGDEDHIMERAHPEPSVVLPAYDRMNGLVENHLERQDMMQFIALKPNHGKLTQHRYIKANQELLKEVIKNAFELDRQQDEKLMTLADSCAERITKESFWPAVGWAALKAAPWVLGALGLVNNFGGKIDQGVQRNAIRAIEELQDLPDKFPKYSSTVYELIDDIQELKLLNQELSGTQVFPQNEKEATQQAKKGYKGLKEYVSMVRAFQKKSSKLIIVLETLGDGNPDETQTWLTEYLGDPGAAIEEYVVKPFWGNDVNDIIQILETLNRSLQESIGRLQKIFHLIKNKADKGDEEGLQELVMPKQEQSDQINQDLDKLLEDHLPTI